jgi:hypothetical protein
MRQDSQKPSRAAQKFSNQSKTAYIVRTARGIKNRGNGRQTCPVGIPRPCQKKGAFASAIWRSLTESLHLFIKLKKE